MTTFNYVALDSKGREITGILQGDDTTNALRRIHELGYFPTNVTRVGKEKKRGRTPSGSTAAAKVAPKAAKKATDRIKWEPFRSGKVKSKDLSAFTRQLAALIEAGLPLLRGLEVLYQQEENPVLKRTIVSVSKAIESGSTFSEALGQHPRVFNRLFVNMVLAGEAGGILDVTLDRLADFQEKAQKIKGKLIAAMAYPAVLMFVATAIVAFLMVMVVPKFQEVFSDMLGGEKMPALTEFVVGASTLVKERFWLVAGAVLSVVAAIALIGKTVKGRYALDGLKLRAPLFGRLIRKASIARFARTLGTLISSGVPILQALTIVRDTTGNSVMALAVTRVHNAVKEGERIIQPLAASRVFPPLVISMVGVGEETGALPDMLLKVADIYDNQVDNAVAGIMSLLEPIMIVFLAVVVGTIVIGMFLPMLAIIVKMAQ